MLERIDLKHARDALHAIDPACSREDWHRIGRAAIAAGLTVEDLDEWSRTASNYSGERDVRAAFGNITPTGGTGPGTLWKAALSTGWRPQKADETEAKPRIKARAAEAPRKAPGRPAEPARAQRLVMGAAEVWNRCKSASADHPYIKAKGGLPEGLRVVPEGDALRANGEGVAGCLVVPVLPLAGGDPVSLQFIAPPDVAAKWKAKGKTDKPNLPGASMAGGVFIVGDLAPGSTVFLCEGIGAAWACWKATGSAAVVCFGWGRVRGVAAELRQRDPSARLVLVPDVGKEDDADRIAAEVGAAVARMPEGWPTNADVNDLGQRDGFDAVEAILASAVALPKPEPRYKLLGSDDLQAMPWPEWRVREVLPAQGLASVFGQSTSGKSFLAFDMAAAIAEGCEWFGYRVNACPVVYVCLEGAAGFRLRVRAWEQHHGRKLPAALRIVLQPFKLTEPRDVEDMAAAVLTAGDGAVTIVDTLNASAPGIDENASRDMGIVLEASKTLQARTGGLVVAVHHSGKDATRGLRGHSSLFAALDAAIEVTRDDDRRSWRVAKSKDGRDGEAHPFRLEVVELGHDSDGEPVSSCVVRRDTAAQDVRRAKLPQGGNQRLVLDALGPMFKDGTMGKPGAPQMRPCIPLETAITAAASRLTCAPDRRAERARVAITGLVARGVLGCNEGWLWWAS